MSKDTINSKDLNRLKKALELHLTWGPVSGWHSSMFDDLSKKIFEQCNVLLSPTTLKRFWGVIKFDGQNSIRTLDTLAQFIGFENWLEFKLKGTRKKTKKIASNFSQKSLYTTIGFFIALFAIMIVGSRLSEEPVNLEYIPFSSRPLSNSYPNSVVFDFDLKNIKAKNLHIQQYWDATKTIQIEPDQNQATGIYYFPGYFRAQMIVNGRSVSEHDLFLKSNGWMGTIEYEPVPKYFTPIALDKHGLTYPKELFQEIKESPEPLVSVFHYIDDLGNVSGDNFNLQASLRNTYNEKWAVCQTTQIYLIGTTGAMIIPFSKIGCSSDISLLLNDVFLHGKKNDLSAFGTDLSHFTNLEVSAKEKEVIISINEMQVYRTHYSNSMGKLVGLRFKFLGLGEVQSFVLKDQTGKPVPLAINPTKPIPF